MSLSSFEPKLADRLSAAKPSATGAMSEAARRLAAQGRSVISLSEGELDFDTPTHIQHAAIKAMVEGQTRYTNTGGTDALKAAIQRKFARDNELRFEASEIIAGTGAKQMLFNALLATVSGGDEVVIVAPYWVSYADMVNIAGGKPVIVTPEKDDGFKMTPAKLRAALNDQTRWLMLNSPCNPSGALYSAEELRKLGEVLSDYPQVMVLSDDIYEEIVFDGHFCSFAQAVPEMRERTLTVNGVSKAYAMTGWRLGYAAGPAWLIRAMALLQSQSTSNPSAISQAAAVAALDGPQGFLDDWRVRLRVRRDLAFKLLSQSDLLSIELPPAAFYLFADCSKAIGLRTPQGTVIESDTDFAMYLLNDAGVAVVPGSAFGLSPYVRFAYALSDERLQAACERTVEACARLERP